MKQNLVKFNNFIKEKRMKIEEGSQKSKKHSQVYKMKQEEASYLVLELENWKAAKRELETIVRHALMSVN